jgi:hypothetical protein
VASGVTGSEEGVAADGSSSQPVGTIGNRLARSTDFCPGLGCAQLGDSGTFASRTPFGSLKRPFQPAFLSRPRLNRPCAPLELQPVLVRLRELVALPRSLVADRFTTSVSRRDRDARSPAERYSRSKAAYWNRPSRSICTRSGSPRLQSRSARRNTSTVSMGFRFKPWMASPARRPLTPPPSSVHAATITPWAAAGAASAGRSRRCRTRRSEPRHEVLVGVGDVGHVLELAIALDGWMETSVARRPRNTRTERRGSLTRWSAAVRSDTISMPRPSSVPRMSPTRRPA